jgi:transcriptional regulator with XRE-family HTH domain
VVLLRKVIGDVLRARRLAQHRTLREVSTAANVSLGYLSEIERGHKEASSELLGSICEALGAGLSNVLSDVAATFALAEQMEEAFSAAGVAERPGERTETLNEARTETSVTDGDVTVKVRSDGPLRTTLTAKRTPGPRQPEALYIG